MITVLIVRDLVVSVILLKRTAREERHNFYKNCIAYGDHFFENVKVD